MTDRLALVLGLLLVTLITADILANGGDVLLFLAKKFADLTEYLIFWR
ncbi:hypothetical protein KM031_01510 [Gemmobacter fulvus]|uniref:Uncharacterized protein n=1 Tax=Gemmobacter fulvus TaxID=2840474 RepID=A0A975S1S5_9RHOB|nr:hypothetical protein [Gemmobacter fulvus]MBT9245030.1 hypothetical protein [Gemmobacter fulvus]QWK90621.1 hypothetical protein KM031_01510 [Gemmobacter fulvus]